MPTRRTFLATSAAVVAAGRAPAAGGPDRLPIALIGTGGMGTNHLKNLVNRNDVDVRYVCDADANRLANAAKVVEGSGKTTKPVRDLRQILDDKEIKAVWIATPDHWHSPAGILAADAGKHVYVEKPCSHNVREGRLLIEAADRNKVVIQVGTQARSTKTVQEAMARLHGGAIGDVLVAKAWNSQLRRNLGKVMSSPPPEHLDYAMWQGPAPEAPFFSNRIPGMWRFFFDYGAGDMGNDGVHNIDVAVWGLGVTTLPSRVACLGGKYFFDDDQQWPDTQYMVAEFDPNAKSPKPQQLIYEQRIWSPYVQEDYENGNAFYGTKGMLIIGHTKGWKLYGPRNKLIEEMAGPVDLPGHHTNFLESIKGNAKPAASSLGGHISAGVCHLANISTRLRRTVILDPVKEQIPTDPEANAMLTRKYREGHWSVPKGV